MNNLEKMQQFVEEFGFGILVSCDEDRGLGNGMQASHLPFILRPNEGHSGTLYTHCARANPQWKQFANSDVLITFSGPHSYVSPTWYKQKPAVPTWNYAAVHVYGRVVLTEKEQSLDAMIALIKKYEPSLLDRDDVMPKDFVNKLFTGIVGFKIKVNRMQGVQKLGQQRSTADQLGVYHALSDSKNADSVALAKYMNKYNLGVGASR
ncbi:FMN-binding negative transcriptional regulator [Paraglaciecola sp. 2405UD69-4]|uniref:FMN-binding negative transcriptional regulator n=1 Tax=Paraglaciecola sp. 2405UD69-4 TaxID=3391836 RepID=UPI0039C997D6